MSGTSSLTLGSRLDAAASYIRRGSVFADIGTDHALLPIYAVKSGLSERAFATDVNRSPLLRAKENIKQYGVSDRITCVLTSGFDSLEGKEITDAAVCGMGGELIADIIDMADFIKVPGFRLILQPMTRPEAARRSLSRCGFAVTSESVVFDGGKYYTVIAADCNGAARECEDEFQALYGDFKVKHFASADVRRGYLTHELSKFERTIKGKSTSGADTSREESIAKKLSAILQGEIWE